MNVGDEIYPFFTYQISTHVVFLENYILLVSFRALWINILCALLPTILLYFA